MLCYTCSAYLQNRGDPNVGTATATVAGHPVVLVFAFKDIQPGEECRWV
jgi:hypothetical protein